MGCRLWGRRSRTRLKRLSSSSPLSECQQILSQLRADYQQSGHLGRAPPTASLVTPSRRVEAAPPRPLNTAFLGCASERKETGGECVFVSWGSRSGPEPPRTTRWAARQLRDGDAVGRARSRRESGGGNGGIGRPGPTAQLMLTQTLFSGFAGRFLTLPGTLFLLWFPFPQPAFCLPRLSLPSPSRAKKCGRWVQ